MRGGEYHLAAGTLPSTATSTARSCTCLLSVGDFSYHGRHPQRPPCLPLKDAHCRLKCGRLPVLQAVRGRAGKGREAFPSQTSTYNVLSAIGILAKSASLDGVATRVQVGRMDPDKRQYSLDKTNGPIALNVSSVVA